VTRITIGQLVTALLVATVVPVSSGAQSKVGQSQPTFRTRLPAGDCLLTIEVKAANNAARRVVRFTVK